MSNKPDREATADEVELEIYEFVDSAAILAKAGEPGAIEAHATLSAAVLVSKRLAEINATLKGIEHQVAYLYSVLDRR
jgi:hypothetical protein